MTPLTRQLSLAMLCAAAVSAQLIGGKATRDALFLTSFDFTALPTMLVATSICSILLVVGNVKAARTVQPGVLVPASFAISGVLFLLESLLRSSLPSAATVFIYLHISSSAPLLASGFWLIVSEQFDPHTARQRFGHIAGAGTLGALASALVAERVATLLGVPAMLPLLAGLQIGSALLVWRLASGAGPHAANRTEDSQFAGAAPRAGVRVLSEIPYLRHLAVLVLLGTTGAALIDYLFKAHAVATFGRGDQLLRFFALYYAGTSVLTFALQASSSSAILARFGLAFTASTPSFALLAGSIGSLLAPGFGAVLAARGAESVLRSSLYRAGYELFYAPMPQADKRAAKSIIDVAFDRLGDAVGGTLVRLCVMLAPAIQSSLILLLAVACSAGAIVAARLVNRGYVRTLEKSLMNGGGNAIAAHLDHQTVGTLMLKALGQERAAAGGRDTEVSRHERLAPPRRVPLDPEVHDIVRLRSRDRARVVRVLARDEGLSAPLVPHVITLLAWDAVAEHAIFALRKVAEERVGELIDALIDPNQEFAVRRRLARVFSVCVSQRAADGLLLALDDVRFDVRCQSARSLLAIVERNPGIKIDRDRVFAVVLREVTVGRPVWESRRLLEGLEVADPRTPLDVFVRDRAGESLAHVFSLLSLVLQREALLIAFRSLQTGEAYMRGTALEYLEEVLPATIRQGLWPYLEGKPLARTRRPRGDMIADLLRSNDSIALNLEQMQREARPVEVNP